MSAALRLAVITAGATGIIAQTMLMRELLAVFSGNEFTLGLILAVWLLGEAAGSALAGRIRLQAAGLTWLLPVAALALATAVVLARSVRGLFPVVTGEVLGPEALLAAAGLVLVPASLLHGALFTTAVRVRVELVPGEPAGAGRVYVAEMLGSILGGLLFSLLLLANWNSFATAALVVLGNLGAGLLLAATQRRIRTGLAMGLLMVMLAATSSFGLAQKLDLTSLRPAHPGMAPVYHGSSPHGDILVLRRADQYMVLQDGVPELVLPKPDQGRAEEVAHLSLLSHPKPERVMLLGGALQGVLSELLKHQGVAVDVIEPDPALPAILEQVIPPPLLRVLHDPRVTLRATDARRWLHRAAPGTYDVIILVQPAPTTLQLNRLCTREFLSLARTRLRPDGILVREFPGAAASLNRHQATAVRGEQATLEAVFPAVNALPGDFMLFLAGTGAALAGARTDSIVARLERRGIETRVVTPDMIALRFNELARRNLEHRTGSAPATVNSDLRPAGVLLGLAMQLSRNRPGLARLPAILPQVPSPVLPLLVLAVLLASVGAAVRPKGRRRRFALRFALFSTGLAGAGVSLLVLLTAQVVLGVLYLYLVLLTTAFMAGSAIGAASNRSPAADNRPPRPADLWLVEAGAGLSGIAVVGAGLLVGQAAVPDWLVTAAFVMLSLVGGFFVGLEFSIVNRLYPAGREQPAADSACCREMPKPDAARQAGTLYAADLLGGVVGALVVPLVLVPAAGLVITGLALAAVKLVSVALLFLSWRRDR